MLLIYWLSFFRFRWAACQINILGILHNVSDIRKALHELPETLDEMLNCRMFTAQVDSLIAWFISY